MEGVSQNLCANLSKIQFNIKVIFSEGMSLHRGFSLLQSEHLLFLNFPGLFSKYFLLKFKLFRHNSYYNKNLLRNSHKIGKKVGIHFYKNILSEINLPLSKVYQGRPIREQKNQFFSNYRFFVRNIKKW